MNKCRTSNSKRVTVILLLLWACVTATGSDRDILTFTNGDSLRGTLVDDNDEFYIFESDNLGTLRVERSAVSKITVRLDPKTDEATLVLAVDSPPAVDADEPAATGPTDAPVLTAVVTPVVTIYQRTVDPVLNFIERSVEIFNRFYPLSHWNNRIDVGLIFQSGDLDKVDYNFNFRTELNNPERPTSVLYTFRRDYGWQRNNDGQSTVTRDRINSTLRYRYSYAQRYFVQTFTQYDRRIVQGVRNDFQQTVGLGYRFLQTESWTGSVTPSAGVRYRQFRARESDGSFSLNLLQDLVYNVNSSLRLSEQLNLSVDPSNSNDFTANLLTSVENRLTERVWLNIRYEFLYNGSIPAGTQPTQHTVTLGMGTQF